MAVAKVSELPLEQSETDGLPETADLAGVEQVADGHVLEYLAHYKVVSAGSAVHPCTWPLDPRRPIL